MSELIGKTLNDQYFLRSLAGSGATSDVYLAWDTIRTTRMAIKILRQDFSKNNRFFQLFAKEAEYLRKLEHPGIVRLYEFNRDGDFTYIVMDWVDGANLHQFIQSQKKPLSAPDISHILASVCPALNYAHHKHIYHCDVKPANILLHTDGRVLLTDFGVAQLANQPGMGGTPPYMAPEQFAGDPIDARTDVYALGISLYEMLSGGEIPFKGTSQQGIGTTLRDRIAWEHLNLEIPSIREYVPDISRGLESVLIKAMAKNPNARYQNTIELKEAFDLNQSDNRNWESPRKTVLDAPVAKTKRQFQEEQSFEKYTKGPYLFARQGEFAGEKIPIPGDGLTIGRSKTCRLRLTEASVSRTHATILVAQNGVFIRDENSSLGTYVNGAPIALPVQLEDGDVIGVGYSQIFEFRSS